MMLPAGLVKRRHYYMMGHILIGRSQRQLSTNQNAVEAEVTRAYIAQDDEN